MSEQPKDLKPRTKAFALRVIRMYSKLPKNDAAAQVLGKQVLILIVASTLPCTAADYEKAIRPLLKEYCLGCHSTEKHKGDLDLERFTSMGEVMKHPKVWQAVVEQISLGEMPPKEKPQPAEAQRVQLLGWANGVLDNIALARSGDPGPVVLRRLSNAEYTCTIRDLTGVESLDPAKEFPADSASGEGFMNVGNSLVMSPSLVSKYLDAAKEIASHAVLLPDGIRFSAKSTGRDWTEELLSEIRATYREFTDNGGGTSVNLQGIRFDTKDGGVLPLDKYLAVLLPDGIRFSPKNTGRDWTEELLAEIRATYREFTDNGGGTSVNLQGIRFDTKDGGV